MKMLALAIILVAVVLFATGLLAGGFNFLLGVAPVLLFVAILLLLLGRTKGHRIPR